MTAEEIRELTCDSDAINRIGGTGDEEALRNLLLSEIAAQLAEIARKLPERLATRI